MAGARLWFHTFPICGCAAKSWALNGPQVPPLQNTNTRDVIISLDVTSHYLMHWHPSAARTPQACSMK